MAEQIANLPDACTQIPIIQFFLSVSIYFFKQANFGIYFLYGELKIHTDYILRQDQRRHSLRRCTKLHRGPSLINMMLKYHDTSSVLSGYNTLHSAHREVLICTRFNFWTHYVQVISYDHPDVALIRMSRKNDGESSENKQKQIRVLLA